jgi:hypothetical protein
VFDVGALGGNIWNQKGARGGSLDTVVGMVVRQVTDCSDNVLDIPHVGVILA